MGQTVTRAIDSHQHFWSLARGDYGWLTPALAPLYRDFLPADLAPLLRSAEIDRTILVQAAPTVAETRFLLDLAQRTDFIAGVIGWVDMAAEDAADVIAELTTDPRLRGIRPMIQDIADIDWMLAPGLTPAFRSLAERDLCFDALVRPQHLRNLGILLGRHPDLKVVIDHGAKPRIADGQFDEWAADMARLARETPALCKISGLVTEAPSGATLESLRPYLDHLFTVFGPERLMWGSDWPVVNLACQYSTWWETMQRYVTPLDPAARGAVLGRTAARFYGIEGLVVERLDD